MTTTTVSVRGEVISPSAIAGKKESAAFGLGHVIRELIHHSNAFTSENEKLAAENAVNDYLAAHIPASQLPALADGNQRAATENVADRIPPQSAAYIVPSNTPAIDYDLLAAALVRAQQQAQANPVPPAPAPASDTVADEPDE